MRGGGNMQQMMKQMQNAKENGSRTRKIKEERVAGTAGGGMVTVTVTGQKKL